MLHEYKEMPSEKAVIKTLLYSKMEKEFSDFEAVLKQKSPDKILDSAYEFCVKRDILLLFEEDSTEFLPESAIGYLHQQANPLHELYLAWINEDSSELELYRSCIEYYLKEEINVC